METNNKTVLDNRRRTKLIRIVAIVIFVMFIIVSLFVENRENRHVVIMSFMTLALALATYKVCVNDLPKWIKVVIVALVVCTLIVLWEIPKLFFHNSSVC